ncbi:MAG: YidB family protein [Pseudomonadales bacterium]
MDLKSMAIKMAMEKMGGGDEGVLGSALGSLLGNSNDDDGFDLGGLAQQFTGGGLGNALQSWLGDGDNDSVSGEQVTNALGADKIAGFAQQLGIGQDEAASKLSDLLPDLMDKSSSGGSLLGNAADLASRFLK